MSGGVSRTLPFGRARSEVLSGLGGDNARIVRGEVLFGLCGDNARIVREIMRIPIL